jgi:hypothetical protein
MVDIFTGGDKVLSDVNEWKRCLDRHENVVSDMVSPIYWFFFYDSGMQIVDDWKVLCNMSDVIDDLHTRVIEKEPVDWRYHIGDDVFVTIKAPFPFVHIRKHFIKS